MGRSLKARCIINYQHAETQHQKKQNKNLIIVSALPQHLYLLTTKQKIFPRNCLCSIKLYSIIVTRTILATAPPICNMGPCQNTDKNLLYLKRLIPAFIAGNKISCLKRKLYYNYVSDWININSTLNFLLVDSHIQFTPFSPFSTVTKMVSLLSGL